jgi:hypothetical protein
VVDPFVPFGRRHPEQGDRYRLLAPLSKHRVHADTFGPVLVEVAGSQALGILGGGWRVRKAPNVRS